MKKLLGSLVVMTLDLRLDGRVLSITGRRGKIPGRVTVLGRANHFTKSPRPTQPPILTGMENEYRPKYGDALRMGSKGRYGLFHLWINVWVGGKNCVILVNTCQPERPETSSS